MIKYVFNCKITSTVYMYINSLNSIVIFSVYLTIKNYYMVFHSPLILYIATCLCVPWAHEAS